VPTRGPNVDSRGAGADALPLVHDDAPGVPLGQMEGNGETCDPGADDCDVAGQGLGLRADGELHADIRRRNCDAAVERSGAFEALDEVCPLLLGDAVQAERQPNGVEDADVGAHRIGRVDLPANLDAHRLEWRLLGSGNDL